MQCHIIPPPNPTESSQAQACALCGAALLLGTSQSKDALKHPLIFKKLGGWSLLHRQAKQTQHAGEIRDVPIFVESNTSLEGIFFFSSSKASIRFSFGCPGSSSIDFHRFMSSTTTTL